MQNQVLIERLMILVPMLLSLTVHEFAHAWSAYLLGDDTASLMGRLTLNPIPHIDLIGTVLVPLLSPVPFGWAKPVPVNPVRFRRGVSMTTGMTITAAAGPIANVVLAIMSAIGFALLYRFSPELVVRASPYRDLLLMMIGVNVALALFNMIPVPPLDGSRIVAGLMPYRLRPLWDGFTRLSPFLLIAVMFFGGRLIAGPSAYAHAWLERLVVAIAG